MKVDVIDLYMAHNIKLPQFRDDLFAELEKVKDEGKIKVWGVSLGPAIGWREEGFKAMLERGAKACQTVFNLFAQNPGRSARTALATPGGGRHRWGCPEEKEGESCGGVQMGARHRLRATDQFYGVRGGCGQG